MIVLVSVYLKRILPRLCHFVVVCCVCHRELSREKAHGFRDKESGGICPRCLKEKFPEIYQGLKESGELSVEQISEAEG